MQIEHGSLWDGPPEAWRVIPTNQCVRRDGTAVMGAGLALQAARRFPDLPRRYGAALRAGRTGLVAFADYHIVCVPTKADWRGSAFWSLLDQAVRELADFAKAHSGESIRVPLLGAGLGGLPREAVQCRLEAGLGGCGSVVLVMNPEGEA